MAGVKSLSGKGLLSVFLIVGLKSLGTRGGDGYPNFRITQPAQISATAGGSVILTCTLSGDGPNGKVKWYKGSGGEERLFYTHSPGKGEQPDSRASFVKDSDRDKSIQITDLTRNDSGTYYCVKFKGDNEELQRGAGTHLYLKASPSPPSILGPLSSVEVDQRVVLICTSEGFSPKDISVSWFKDGAVFSASHTSITPIEEFLSYHLYSIISVTTVKHENASVYACEINHETLSTPMVKTFHLDYHITRVSQFHSLSIFIGCLALKTSFLAIVVCITLCVINRRGRKKVRSKCNFSNTSLKTLCHQLLKREYCTLSAVVFQVSA
nr:PREDICTED: tyrosine-protein phosphatase non-receptor type substrate 1-like [Latimeria chalumnae]|eukprot:XP_014350917.1 PREDICTED: tyrosine-protein phosphatase non-receptor type substrate 1-like [Latimeria chalumnae]